MNLLMRLEKWLEDKIDRFFGPRESVQPIEIARRMVRAMEDQRRISVRCTYVPNSFVVHVSKEDLAELDDIAQTLTQDLANHVQAAAARQSCAFPGPVTVQFEADPALGRGELRITAQFVEGEEESRADAAEEERVGHTGRYRQAPAAPAPAEIDSTQLFRPSARPLLTWQVTVEEGPDAGASYTVRLPAVIGRRQGCDIQLHDLKVSRLHARLEMTPEGLVVSDADSTNGTRVNGRIVKRAIVNPSDSLEVGNSRLAIRPAGGE